jgi:uncharacterized membrane protein YgdD (TMEM256/DUF423 family)
MLKRNTTLCLAAVLGGLAVLIGAFGAHGLKGRVSAELLDVYDIGVRYHFYHALALLALATAATGLWKSRWTAAAAGAWIAGILLFSGSLYALALTGVRWLGAITPMGGVAFVAGWVCLLLAALATRD